MAITRLIEDYKTRSGKGKIVPVHMKIYGRVEVEVEPYSLTSAVDGGGW
jgi:hypothetical protein